MLKHEKEYEVQQFKAMNFREKLAHIFTYYRTEILVGLCIAILGGWALNQFILNPPAEKSLTVLSLGGSYSETGLASMQEECLSAFPEFVENGEELFFTSLLIFVDNTENAENLEANEANFTKLVGMLSAHELDIIISDKQALEACNISDFFLPLTEVFTEAELAEMYELSEQRAENNVLPNEKDIVSVIYDKNEEEDEESVTESPYLLCLGGHEGASSLFHGVSTPYIGIASTTDNFDNAKAYFRYLVTGEKE